MTELRISRRRLWSILGSSALALWAAGCSSAPAQVGPTASSAGSGKADTSSAQTSAPATSPSKPANAQSQPVLERVVFGTESPPTKSPNPLFAGNPLAGEYYWPTYDALLWNDRNGRPQPVLAKSWRATDATTWEFVLRDDVRFHDGSDLTAEDVVGTYEHARNPENRLTSIRLFTSVDRVEAVDQTTVRVVTKYPDPALPKRLAMSFILPWRKVMQVGIDEFFKAPVGTGPYRWVGGDFNNALHWELMPPDFVTPRAPGTVRRLEMHFIPEVATRAAALRTGEIDIAERLAPDAAAALEAEGFVIAVDPGSSALCYSLNTFYGPTTDVRVRHAINYAVDKEAILKSLLHGYGDFDAQLIGKDVLGYNPDLQPYPYDPARAKQLLAEAGYPDGFEMDVWAGQSFGFGAEIGQAVLGYLRNVGITGKVNVLETAVYVERNSGTPDKHDGAFPMLSSWNTTFEPDPWSYFSVTELPVERGGRWTDEIFDRLYQSAKAEPDETLRAEKYRAAGKYLHEQAPVLFMWQSARLSGMRPGIRWQPGYYADMYTTLLPE